MTVIDVRYVTKVPWAVSIVRLDETAIDRAFRPYFYVIYEARRSIEQYVKVRLTDGAKKMILGDSDKIIRRFGKSFFDQVLASPCTIYDTDMKAWVFDKSRYRYVRALNYAVAKVELRFPQHVSKLAEMLMGIADAKDYAKYKVEPMREARYAAFNIKYVARYVLDNYFARPLDIVPIYFDLDTEIFEKLSRLRYVVYDIEKLKDGTYVLSILETHLFEEMSTEEAMDRTLTFVFKSPEDPDAEEAYKVLSRARVLVGFNNMEYDDPELMKLGVLSKDIYEKRCVIDLCKVIRNIAQPLGVGTTSMSLADILMALKPKLNISFDVLIIKLMGRKMLKDLNKAILYNRNDVVATRALAEFLLSYVFGVAGMVQVSPMAVTELKFGQLFEYAFVHWLELSGEIIEARLVYETPLMRELLKGEKVFIFKELDVLYSIVKSELEKAVKESDINRAVKLARQAVAKLLPELKKRAREKNRSGKRSRAEETEKVRTLFSGKIVHMDVEMMYPTKILKDEIDPCCYVKGTEERAVFSATTMDAPFYSFVKRLYMLRAYVKKLKKEAKARGDKRGEALYDLLSNLIKPIINSAYGAMSKSSRPTHGGHFQVSAKIFHGTIWDILTLLLLLRAYGYYVIYSDTDSLFFLAKDGEDPEQASKIAEKIAEALGYKLSLEGVYDFMYILAEKNYIVGGVEKKGDKEEPFIKLKGQAFARLKYLTSPLVRSYLLDAIKERNLNKLEKLIMEIDDVSLLIPPQAKPFRDIFLKTVEDIKRMSPEDRSKFLQVLIPARTRTGERKYIRGLLKSIRPAERQLARLAALALRYGKKTKDGSYIIKFAELPSIDDLADLSSLLLARCSGDTLTGDSALVVLEDEEGNWKGYIVTVDPNKCSYILVDENNEKRIIPLTYSDLWRGREDRRKNSELVRKVWKLVAVKIGVDVIKEVTDINEVKQYVLDVVREYIKWSGLHKIVNITQTAKAKQQIATILDYVYDNA